MSITASQTSGLGFLKADGSVPLTANWAVGGFSLTGAVFLAPTFAGNVSAASWTTTGIQAKFSTATYTDTSTAASGTAASAVAIGIKAPAFASTNATVTNTIAATLYIEAPTQGANVTNTNVYSLWTPGSILVGQFNTVTATPKQIFLGEANTSGTSRPQLVICTAGSYIGIGQSSNSGTNLRIAPLSGSNPNTTWSTVSSASAATVTIDAILGVGSSSISATGIQIGSESNSAAPRNLYLADIPITTAKPGISFGTAGTNKMGIGADITTGNLIIGNNANITSWTTKTMYISNTGTAVSIGTATLTAYLTLGAGTATASTGPLKFTSSGTGLTGLLTAAESGVIEFTTYGFWVTPTSATRHKMWEGLIGASAPSTSVLTAFVNYYGTGGTVALSTPNTWATITGDDGNVYKVPGYS